MNDLSSELVSKWIPVFNDFVERQPSLASQVVDWYPSGQMEIVIKLYDGTKLIYNWLIDSVCRYDSYTEYDDDEESLKRIFGYRVKNRLYILNMSQEDLAEKTGISYVTISKYVHGKSSPSITNAKRIAKALKCQLRELIDGYDV